MKALLLFVGWCLLFVLCWPIALLALLLAPLVWIVGLVFGAVGALLKAILFLPARLLGGRPT